jgi:hypothetical protein
MKKKQGRRFERRAPVEVEDSDGEINMNNVDKIQLLPEGIEILAKESFVNGVTYTDIFDFSCEEKLSNMIKRCVDVFMKENPEKARYITMDMPMDTLLSALRYMWDRVSENFDKSDDVIRHRHMKNYVGYLKHRHFAEVLIPKALTDCAETTQRVRKCVKKCVVRAIVNIKLRAREAANASRLERYQPPYDVSSSSSEFDLERERLRRERAAASRAARLQEEEAAAGRERVVRNVAEPPLLGPWDQPGEYVDAVRRQVAKAASIEAASDHEKRLQALERLRIDDRQRKLESLRISREIGGS